MCSRRLANDKITFWSEDGMAKEVLNRRERERERHRAEILRAAEDVFTEKGFHGASMQDIAERAEFAVGTLYKFFPGKDDLYHTLFFEKVSEIDALVGEAMDKESEPAGKLERLIEINLQIAEKYKSFFGLYLREMIGRSSMSPTTGPQMIKLRDQSIKRIGKVITAGINQGVLRKTDPRAMTMVLMGMLRGSAFIWIEGQHKLTLDELTETVKKMFFKGALAEGK